jgi:sugar phosphate isomerase/epimerase
MRISVSNIAWDIGEEPDIAVLLRDEGIDRVDLAPGKYFADPEQATPSDITAVKNLWEKRGFRIEGMQALLFGTHGLNLFADADGLMFRRLAAVCRIGGGLGARALTFGSPRQRDRGELNDKDAQRIAVDFFSRLGDVAAAEGVVVCLEPNPAVYHCNFMVRTAEAAAVVEAINHRAVRLQLDVGAMALNQEDALNTIRQTKSLIGHVHASEPQLAVLGDGGAPHEPAAQALREYRPELTVTIEMAAAKESHLTAVQRAVRLAKSVYGDCLS